MTIKDISLFFTYGYSLDTWYKMGTLDRDLQLYKHMAKYGYKFSLVTYGNADEKNYLPNDTQFSVLSRPDHIPSRLYKIISSLIHARDIQKSVVIKTHQIQGALSGVVAKIIFRKPFIARCGYLKSVFAQSEGEPWIDRIIYSLEEFFAFYTADIVCVPSNFEANYASRRYKLPREKFKVCPNWIDTKIFTPVYELHDAQTICFVGRLVEKKGPHILLEALKGVENVKLLMIGSGPMKNQLTSYSEKNQINVEYIDQIPNNYLPKYLNQCCIYVLPTHHEGGSPKTLLEAMSCGLPVISTNGFGVNECFDNRVQGIKVDYGDVDGLRNAIMKLLHNPELIMKYGANGRTHVINNFSVEKAVERELDIIRSFTER